MDVTTPSKSEFLPTAYVVRREGYVLTRVCPSVCPHLGGGVPQPGPDGGVYPSQGDTPLWVPPVGPGHGGTPAGGVPHLRYPLSDLAGGYPTLGTPPVGPGWGVPLLGGTPPRVPLPSIGPGRGGGGVPDMEYLIRRGRYASCVHAGGLSCI